MEVRQLRKLKKEKNREELHKIICIGKLFVYNKIICIGKRIGTFCIKFLLSHFPKFNVNSAKRIGTCLKYSSSSKFLVRQGD